MFWLAFTADWMAVVGLCAVASLTPWAIWPCALLIGLFQHAIGELGHQAAHKQCGRFSGALMWACFAPMCIDPSAYKRFHFAHHRHLGDLTRDPEVWIVRQFRDRWTEPYRGRDSLLDAMGLHADESIYVLTQMSSLRALAIYLALLAAAVLLIGPLALIWPLAAVTGLMTAHRLRARTEHQHLTAPGVTLESVAPTWRTFWFLPHGTWRHKAHHEGKS